MIEVVSAWALEKVVEYALNYAYSEFKKWNNPEISEFEKELTLVIYSTIEDYKEKFPHKDEGGKYSFVKSSAVLENLLKSCFLEKTSEVSLADVINQEPNVYPPSANQLKYFIKRLEENLSGSKRLKNLYIQENFKEEIYNISDKLDSLHEKVEKVTNSLEGLPNELIAKLHFEYHRQVQEIKSDLEDFHISSALRRLEGLEKNLTPHVDSNLLSKITFLRALCIKELYPTRRTESAQLVVKAYKLNPEDLSHKRNACVEYFNLDDLPKAEQVADKLLEVEEYDTTGWVTKTICSEEIKIELQKVPTIVRDSKNFNNSVSHFLIYSGKTQKIEELSNYGVKIKIDEVSFPELSIYNRQLWIRDLFLLYNEVIQNQHVQYITGPQIEVEIFPKLDLLTRKLKHYLDILDPTELKDQNYDLSFVYHYFLYRNNPSKQLAETIDQLYRKTHRTSLSAIQYSQILNHQERYENALSVLEEELVQDANYSEVLMFKSVVFLVLKDYEKAKNMVLQFIDSVPIIKYNTYRNLEMLVVNIFNHSSIDKAFSKMLLHRIREKSFENERLKKIIELHIKVKFVKDNEEKILEIKEEINELSRRRDYVFLLMDLNFILKDFDRNIVIFEKHQLPFSISQEMLIYIHSLYSLLYSKESRDLQDSSKKLLTALEFYRNNSSKVDEELFTIEYELLKSIQNWSKAKIIAHKLYTTYSSNELYQGFLAECYYHLDDISELKKLSENLSDQFDNEEIGIMLSQVLFTKDVNEEKAFAIIFNLAQNKTNTLARREYFARATFSRKILFPEYNVVEKGLYVEFVINEKTFIDYVDENHAFIEHLVGDKITTENPLTHQLETTRIIKCFDDRVKLLRDITKEADNPLNKLGFQSFNFDAGSPEKFKEQIQSIFGPKEMSRNEFIQKTLKSYERFETDYATITSSLFEEDYFQSYSYLTEQFQFNTIPININKELDGISQYVIDFSTLFMLFQLEKELQLEHPKKFIISPLIKKMIEELIAKEKINPRSSLKLHVDPAGIRPIKIPEDYSEKIIQTLLEVKEWIEINCEEQHVEEKLDVYMKLENKSRKDFFQVLVDSVYLGMRPNYGLLTNDYFYLKYFAEKTKIQSGESYLQKIIDSTKIKDLYVHLLKKKYVGLAIPLEVLKDVFIESVAQKDDCFRNALKSFSPAISPELKKEEKVIQLVRYIYLTNIDHGTKKFYVHLIFSSTFPGSDLAFRQNLRNHLVQSFSLLPAYSNEVLRIFVTTEETMYG